MKQAAIGFRVHSGWAALVTASHDSGKVEILERRRVSVAHLKTSGPSQPYHRAENMKLIQAERFIANFFIESECLAVQSIRKLLDELRARQISVVGSAILLASGRMLPPLPKILASHALIHAAEGEFFRNVFTTACNSLDLPVTGIKEGDLDKRVEMAFGVTAFRIKRQISGLSRTLGPPWTKDQKTAALAALIVWQINGIDSHSLPGKAKSVRLATKG